MKERSGSANQFRPLGFRNTTAAVSEGGPQSPLAGSPARRRLGQLPQAATAHSLAMSTTAGRRSGTVPKRSGRADTPPTARAPAPPSGCSRSAPDSWPVVERDALRLLQCTGGSGLPVAASFTKRPSSRQLRVHASSARRHVEVVPTIGAKTLHDRCHLHCGLCLRSGAWPDLSPGC